MGSQGELLKRAFQIFNRCLSSTCKGKDKLLTQQIKILVRDQATRKAMQASEHVFRVIVCLVARVKASLRSRLWVVRAWTALALTPGQSSFANSATARSAALSPSAVEIKVSSKSAARAETHMAILIALSKTQASKQASRICGQVD